MSGGDGVASGRGDRRPEGASPAEGGERGSTVPPGRASSGEPGRKAQSPRSGGMTSSRAGRPRALVWFSLSVLGLLLFTSLGAGMISPYNPAEQDLDHRFEGPGSPGHLLGTDSLGRDVLSRLLYGGRSALIVGLVSCSVALVIGGTVALLAAFGPRWLESVLMLFMDGLLAMPAILMAVAIVAVFGYGLSQVMLAMGIIFSPLIARLLRAEFQKARHQDFVEAEYLVNRRGISLFFSTILPQAMPPLTVQMSSLFAAAVTIEASLSFLGIGIQPPQSSWGIMLNDARDYLISDPWLAFPPGIALALTVYALNTLGDILNERFH